MFWIVLAEVGLMFALLAVSWRAYHVHRPAAGATAAIPTAVAPSPAASPELPARVPARPSPTPAPGGAPRTGFPVDLTQLNRDQSSLERAETRVLLEVVRVARSYLDRVVVPAVERAERVARATSPAATHSPAAIVKIP